MSPELEAHLRLMSILPVRTHRQEDAPGRPNAFPEDELAKIKKQMKKMRGEGASLKQIGKAFSVAPSTVLRYLK